MYTCILELKTEFHRGSAVCSHPVLWDSNPNPQGHLQSLIEFILVLGLDT